ncbi:hypothetical protein BJY52DRAFT_186079 [Lactarius psammicola]|nr:hypothetical protein BJY52DRAFT_186079 [Lactarius psammicola]
MGIWAGVVIVVSWKFVKRMVIWWWILRDIILHDPWVSRFIDVANYTQSLAGILPSYGGMNELTQSHSEHLLSKEWLVKIDNENSIPYLMKVHSSFADQTCVFMITDTKSVWVEVLSKQRLSSRWSTCNPNSTLNHLSRPEEDSWLDQALQYLEDVHSLGAIGDLYFTVRESRYSDLAIDLRGDGFNWQWETFSIGPKQSADVLSKHLILPLLSTAYLAFISPDAISEISSNDLEKTVDRIGRTARRSVDTHIRNIFSQPRICTSVRRVSALFAFSANPPPITDKPERPQLDLPSVDSAAGSGRTSHQTPTTRTLDANNPPKETREVSITRAARLSPGPATLGQATVDSTTESGEDDVNVLSPPIQRGNGEGSSRPTTAAAAQGKSTPRAHSPASLPRSRTPAKATRSAIPSKVSLSDSDSDSPPRQNKRPRAETGKGSDDDDNDSDDGPKRGGTRWRGTKQPIKRVGRQF